jgi:S1-C subfamily serine protease
VYGESIPDPYDDTPDLSPEEKDIKYDLYDDAVFGFFDGRSGFIISDSGIAVTAAHIIEGLYGYPDVKLADGTWVEITGVYVFDTASDIAIIQLSEDFGPYPYMDIESIDNVSLGDIVYLVPAPRYVYEYDDFYHRVQETYNHFDIGRIIKMGYEKIKLNNASVIETETIEISADTFPGNSGSPIVNESGKAIGLASSSTTGSGRSTAINIMFIDIDAVAGMSLQSVTEAQLNDKNGKPAKPPLLSNFSK